MKLCDHCGEVPIGNWQWNAIYLVGKFCSHDCLWAFAHDAYQENVKQFFKELIETGFEVLFGDSTPTTQPTLLLKNENYLVTIKEWKVSPVSYEKWIAKNILEVN
ncbi:hypothetical protein LCGC14_0495280 [marine sediment metagenome]|uniref:Uncharacterized protein n=1 Tax=marine sediment metagenome TaxID=412755 RepID=A0A0F9USF5_9ZZZZ|nr:hypothetical protein [bacterium]